MVSAFVGRSAHARSSLKDVEEESSRRPALVFTDSGSLETVKKEVGQSHDKRFRIVVSMLQRGGEYIAAMVADTFASRRSSDEDEGKEHPSSHSSTVVRSNLWPRKSMRAEQPQKMFMLPRNEFQLLLTRIRRYCSRFLSVYCEHF